MIFFRHLRNNYKEEDQCPKVQKKKLAVTESHWDLDNVKGSVQLCPTSVYYHKFVDF